MREYGRLIGSHGRVPDVVMLVGRHAKRHGVPNVLSPKTFTDKVLHRLLFDRRPVLTQMADKYAARGYIEDRCGLAVLPVLYAVSENPRTLPFGELPQRFVVKPTHSAARVRVVHDKTRLDREELIATCERWLSAAPQDRVSQLLRE